jgi:hypothetical protein
MRHVGYKPPVPVTRIAAGIVHCRVVKLRPGFSNRLRVARDRCGASGAGNERASLLAGTPSRPVYIPMPPKDNPRPRHLTLDECDIYDAQTAAKYCGFKTPSGLRKARLRGQVAAFGRRGRGTWLCTRAELDRFLGRGGAATVAEERAGTPSLGNAEYERKTHPQVQYVACGDEISGNLQSEERRLSSSDPSDGPLVKRRRRFGKPCRERPSNRRWRGKPRRKKGCFCS